MSLLDCAFEEDLGTEMITDILRKYVHGSLEVEGFYRWNEWEDMGTWHHITKLPDNYLDWILYRCISLNNNGFYSCIIMEKEIGDKLCMYKPLTIADNTFAYTLRYMRVSDLLDWYNKQIK